MLKLTVALLAGTACLAIEDGTDESYFKPAHFGQQGAATGYWLTDAAEKDKAVCLDGTPGVYYHRPGTGAGSKKWYIHQQGGGWCESYSSCYSRALADLGSSKNYPKAATFEGGYFDTDPKNNPMMFDWNLGYLKYCDGNSFSGSNITSQPYSNLTLHFRGRHILDAAITDLLQNRGLKEATDVVVSGCSAGGLATFLHCDYWAEKIQEAGSSAKVVCMPDSGFFLDYEGPPKYHSGMMWAFYAQNSTSGVNQDCIRAHTQTKDEWMCMFAEHTAPHIKTPTFPLQSVYDSWQVNNDLHSSDPATINEWGANLTKLIQTNLLNQPQHSVFLDSCLHHCGGWDNIRINGDLQAVGFQKWYEGQVRTPYIQGKPYKCDACCQP